jgi:hypothetical protein
VTCETIDPYYLILASLIQKTVRLKIVKIYVGIVLYQNQLEFRNLVKVEKQNCSVGALVGGRANEELSQETKFSKTEPFSRFGGWIGFQRHTSMHKMK